MSALVRSAAVATLLLAAALTLGAASVNDFPTIDRVLFVENCVRDHPNRPRQEMLYKCSCAVDAMAGEFAYDEYVELATRARSRESVARLFARAARGKA